MLTLLAHMGETEQGTWSGMMGPGMMNWNQSWGMMGQGGFWLWSILSWATWVLVLVVLVALIRWLWKKGNK